MGWGIAREQLLHVYNITLEIDQFSVLLFNRIDGFMNLSTATFLIFQIELVWFPVMIATIFIIITEFVGIINIQFFIICDGDDEDYDDC